MGITFPSNADTDLYDFQANALTSMVFDTPGFYYFDASDAGPTDSEAGWSNDANAFDGSTSTSATAIIPDRTLSGTGTNAPSSGPAIDKVRCHTINGNTTLLTPTGGWTWAKVQALEVRMYDDDLLGVQLTYHSSGQQLGSGYIASTNVAKVWVQVLAEDDYLLLLATGDDDAETWNTPTGMTEIFQVNDTGGDDASIGAWYRKADAAGYSQTLTRSGGEEQVGVMMVVRGADPTNFLDVTFAAASHFASQQNDDTPDPPSITTVTDGAAVITLVGNRSDTEHLGSDGLGVNWTVVPSTGYTVEDAGSMTANRGTNAEGAPGRLEMGSGNGDAQMTWAYKIVATAGSEDPSAWSGFAGTRDMKVATFAIRPAPSSTPKSSTDSGSGTEATPTVIASDTETDAGSGADSEDLAAALTTETDAGTSSEAESVSQGAIDKSDTDSGSGVETEALAAADSDTDTGAGSETEASSAVVADADSGTDSELDDVAAAIADTDANGAVTEAETVVETNAVADTDAGSGTELEALTSTMLDTDSGTSAEAEALSSVLSDTDSGSGSEAETSAVPVTDTDAGSGSNEAEALSAALEQVDTGTAASTQGHTAALSDTDAGTGTDAETVSTEDTKTDTDTGAGVETQAVSASIDDTDTATGADTETVDSGTPKADTDTGTGTEAETIAAADSDTDSSAGTESESLAASTVDSDSGSGADTESVSTGTFIDQTDAGTAAESQSVEVQVATDDTGTATDTQANAATLDDLDAGAGSEDLVGIALTGYDDTGNATETEVLIKSLYDTDTGVADDGNETFAPYDLAQSDVATSTDLAYVWIQRAQAGRGLTDNTSPIGRIAERAGPGQTDDGSLPGLTSNLQSRGESQ
ncbi:MAG: hypothetical protein ABFR89_02495 [Actinomycetota bacterium]